MRIVTWNCRRRRDAEAVQAVDRLGADVLVLTEVRESVQDQMGERAGEIVWSAVAGQLGVAIAARKGWSVERVEAGTCHLVARVTCGDVIVPVVGVWSHPLPSYSAAVLQALSEVRAHLEGGAAVIAGDFNSTPTLPGFRRGHETIVGRLNEAGYVSAYHSFVGVEHGKEIHPTHYWRYKRESRSHIDYCFVPRSWQIAALEVGTFEEWIGKGRSDHAPVVVEVRAVSADLRPSPVPLPVLKSAAGRGRRSP